MRSMVIFLLMFVCLACESKPTKSETALGSETPSGKLTPKDSNARPAAIDLQVIVEEGPSQFESALLTNASVLSCLRGGVDPMDKEFYVGLAGRVSATGALSRPLVTGGHPALNLCLVGALKELKFPEGQAQSFRVLLRRASPGQGKTFLLKLNPVKKFE